MKTSLRAALAATLVLCGAPAAMAAPLTQNLAGTVIDGSGGWAGHVGTPFSADLAFDLDETNAFAKELLTPAGEPPFTRWTYFSPAPFAPYGAGFSGAFGAFATGRTWLEVLDDFDADANGNPFGVTGTVDILTVAGGNVVVDCTGGIVHPVTGCNIPGAPALSGEEFLVHFIAGDSWFTGDTALPGSLPPPGGLLAVYGQGEQISGGAVSADVVIEFQAFVAVPEPAAAGVLGLAVVALGAAARRRRGRGRGVRRRGRG